MCRSKCLPYAAESVETVITQAANTISNFMPAVSCSYEALFYGHVS